MLIIPDQVVPVFFNFEIEKVEERFRFDGFEDILAVSVSITNFGFGSLKEEAVRVGEDYVRTNAPKVCHELLEGFLDIICT